MSKTKKSSLSYENEPFAERPGDFSAISHCFLSYTKKNDKCVLPLIYKGAMTIFVCIKDESYPLLFTITVRIA